MGKAILVIDMPKIDKNTKNGCRNCRYAEKRMTLSEEYTCVLTGQSAYVYDMECPLKPLPQKKNEKDVEEIYLTDARSWTNGFSDGYNYCIDEILG